MARDKGLLNISANFEPQTAQPFDARMRVQTLADLTNATQWEANDGTVYAYVGMITVVSEDEETVNGIYRLKAADYTIESNWVKEASSSNDIATAIEAYMNENEIVDEDYITYDCGDSSLEEEVEGDYILFECGNSEQ